MEHKAEKINSGEYNYRGFRITRVNSVRAGVWGAWKINLTSVSKADTLKAAKARIDRHLDVEPEETDLK